MKVIPWLIVGIVVLSLAVNLFLLFNKAYRERYFFSGQYHHRHFIGKHCIAIAAEPKKNKGFAK